MKLQVDKMASRNIANQKRDKFTKWQVDKMASRRNDKLMRLCGANNYILVVQ